MHVSGPSGLDCFSRPKLESCSGIGQQSSEQQQQNDSNMEDNIGSTSSSQQQQQQATAEDTKEDADATTSSKEKQQILRLLKMTEKSVFALYEKHVLNPSCNANRLAILFSHKKQNDPFFSHEP